MSPERRSLGVQASPRSFPFPFAAASSANSPWRQRTPKDPEPEPWNDLSPASLLTGIARVLFAAVILTDGVIHAYRTRLSELLFFATYIKPYYWPGTWPNRHQKTLMGTSAVLCRTDRGRRQNNGHPLAHSNVEYNDPQSSRV